MSEKNLGIDKKYKVILEKDPDATDGYEFFSPEEMQIHDDGKSRCAVTYYYKKVASKHNPIMVIETIDGDDFDGRYGIVSHFERRHALTYAVAIDGLYEDIL